MNLPAIGVLILLLFVIGGRLWARHGIIHTSVHDVRARMRARDPMLLIDVRSPAEFQAGHIAGAVNIPLGGLAEGVRNLKPDREVLLVCHSGNRSMAACRKLKALGFTNVKNVEGGMRRWPWETV